MVVHVFKEGLIPNLHQFPADSYSGRPIEYFLFNQFKSLVAPSTKHRITPIARILNQITLTLQIYLLSIFGMLNFIPAMKKGKTGIPPRGCTNKFKNSQLTP